MHLGDKLKEYKKQKDKDQKQMAGLLGFSVRKYAEIERTGEVTKVEDQEVIYKLIGGDKQKDAYSGIKYETKEDILRMLDKSLDANIRHASANEENANNLTVLVKLLAKRFNLSESDLVSPPLKEVKKPKRDPVERKRISGKGEIPYQKGRKESILIEKGK